MGNNDKPCDLWTSLASGFSCLVPKGPRVLTVWGTSGRTPVSNCLLLILTHAKHSASKIELRSKQMINRALRVSPLTRVSQLTANNGGPAGQRFKDFLIKVTQTWAYVLVEKKLCLSLKRWQVNNPFSNGPTAVKWTVCSYFYCYHLSLTHIFLFSLSDLKWSEKAQTALQ